MHLFRTCVSPSTQCTLIYQKLASFSQVFVRIKDPRSFHSRCISTLYKTRSDPNLPYPSSFTTSCLFDTRVTITDAIVCIRIRSLQRFIFVEDQRPDLDTLAILLVLCPRDGKSRMRNTSGPTIELRIEALDQDHLLRREPGLVVPPDQKSAFFVPLHPKCANTILPLFLTYSCFGSYFTAYVSPFRFG